MEKDRASIVFEKLRDALMFREGSYEDNYTTEPKVTIGSIIWGVLLRSAIIVFGALLVAMALYQKVVVNWWIIFFAMWIFVVFPAFRQYRKFDERIDELEESTMCGSCRYFIKDSQLCRLYDEHISMDYLPCNGESWEPKSYGEEDE
jgi:hypothetical protein